MTDKKCFDHISLLWIAVVIAWLATGVMFITGTQQSRETDEMLQKQIHQLKEAIKECTGGRA